MVADHAVYVADLPHRKKQFMHPKALYSFLLASYFVLLWRSTSKAENTHILLHKESIFGGVTAAHKSLLKYITAKAVRLLTVVLLVFKQAFGNVLQGPAAVAADFLSRQGVALQDTVQSKFEEFLESQLDVLGEKTKETIGDPFMPEFIHNIVNDVVDTLVPDAKRLILTKTDELIRYRSPVTRHLMVGNAVILGAELGQARARRSKAEAENANGIGAINFSAIAIQLREQTVETITMPYRWWFRSTSDKQTDEILDQIVDEPLNDDAEDSEGDSENEAELDSTWRSIPNRLRAKLLYVSAPCDKSIWQCLRDWRWLLLTAFGISPYGIGTLWWLFMFALHDKRDEYQICNFIVGFMVSKFLGGCGLLLYGAFRYYLCATRDVMTCDVDGPRVTEHYDGILFFLQTLLVWLCFFILPTTHPCKSVKDERDAYLVVDMERVHSKLGANRPRGGRLVDFFWWDSFCVFFVLSLALFAWGIVGQDGWMLRTTLFWLKAIFGLLSMPFLLFKIPVLNTLLMQVRATGYDDRGRVVLHTRARPTLNLIQPFIPKSPIFDAGINLDPTRRLERQASVDDILAPMSDDEMSDTNSEHTS